MLSHADWSRCTYIGTIASISLPCPGVHIEVISSLTTAFGFFVVVIGLVVVFGEKSQALVGDLGIQVPIPRQDL